MRMNIIVSLGNSIKCVYIIIQDNVNFRQDFLFIFITFGLSLFLHQIKLTFK